MTKAPQSGAPAAQLRTALEQHRVSVVFPDRTVMLGGEPE